MNEVNLFRTWTLPLRSMAGLAENVKIHDNKHITVNTLSFSDADNIECSESDDVDDDWREVEEHP